MTRKKKLTAHSSSIPQRDRLWWPSENGPPGTVYPDSSFGVANVPVAPGTNTLTATYIGLAFTNVPMTATDTSTVVLGDTSYTHDANGNLTSDATFLYQYDLANQLTNVIRKADNSVVLQCRYDALGRRVEAIRSDGTVDRYVYFPGSFLVLAVLDATNTPKEFYTRGPDLSGTLSSAGGIGGILACTYATAPTAPLYHHADLMGNIIALTDYSATLVSSFRYTPFGQIVTFPISKLPRYLFSSKEFNSSSGLYYYGYRYYSPLQHQWIVRDYLEELDDANLYVACGNSPLNYSDFWGLLHTGQTFPVNCLSSTNRVGVITIQNYSTHVERLNYAGAIEPHIQNKYGATLQMEFSIDCECCLNNDYRWIQTVLEDTSPANTNKMSYNDTVPTQLPGDSEPPYYYPRSLLSQYRGPSSFQFNDTPMEPDASMRLMPADFAGRKHIRVHFRTDLVCASEANRVMHSVEWGFEYQLDAKGNSHVFLINNN